MGDSNFEIRILDLHWINHIDDPEDLCAHGKVFVKIGDEVVADKDSLNVTVSSTALYLMRTLRCNYKMGDWASQLLPCCGHFFMLDEEKRQVAIAGCPNGIDWTIIHTDDNKVKHITDSGQIAIIEKDIYLKFVVDFADRVEEFYKHSLPKRIPEDDFDKSAYLAFWKEWRELREEWNRKQ